MKQVKKALIGLIQTKLNRQYRCGDCGNIIAIVTNEYSFSPIFDIICCSKVRLIKYSSY